MKRTARRALAALACPALLLAGCAAPTAQQSSVPQVTVGGTPDSQRSLAPGEVLGARRDAGIQDCPASDPAATQRPGGLPALTLDCMGADSRVNLAGLPTGRPWVVNVWAQWCTPCEQEAPYLAEVAGQAAGRVEFLGIDYDDPFPGKAVDFAVRTGTRYPQLVDPERRTRVPLRVSVVPQTLFVDARGRVVHRETTPFASAQQLRDAIRQHLGVEVGR